MTKIRKKNILLEDNHHQKLANDLWDKASKLVSPSSHFLINETLNRWGLLHEEDKRRFLRALIKIIRTKTDSIRSLQKEAMKSLDEVLYQTIDPSSSAEEDMKKILELTSKLTLILQVLANPFFQKFEGWDIILKDTNFSKITLELQGYLLKISLGRMPYREELRKAVFRLFDDSVTSLNNK